METLTAAPRASVTNGIVESKVRGLVVLSPAHGKVYRRVLFTNVYGGSLLWKRIKDGEVPPHHLWGCLELVRKGYEVALAEPLPDFYFNRKAVPHDLMLIPLINDWLGRNGIVYCGHNVLYWIPLLRRSRIFRSPVVSLLYAREPLNHSRAHQGVIALNPAAEEQARKLAPQAKIAHLGWGGDLNFFPRLPYQPNWLLSCGITYRDHATLSKAAAQSKVPIRLICSPRPANIDWPPNVEVTDGGHAINIDSKPVTYEELLNDYYSNAAASLIITGMDTTQGGACGFTNLIEAMAMARPVIITRTGALATEIDVEREKCGLHVPPGDPIALAKAMETLLKNPAMAEEMGRAGRRLCETRYNIGRYANELHEFFELL